jgi:hypothetical protein
MLVICGVANCSQREEEVAELAADLLDVKLAYREQVEFLANKLEAAQAQQLHAAGSAGAAAQDTSLQ